MIQIINVIASIDMEHDWPPENRFTRFGNHARVSRPDMMLSAGVAELVDALDLGSSDESCGGSSPSARTILRSADDLTAERLAGSANRTRSTARHKIPRIPPHAFHSRFFSSAGGLAGAAAGLSGIFGAAGLISFARGGS